MTNTDSSPATESVTAIDIALAAAYYPLLKEQAVARQLISYGALVDLAKQRYPGDPTVQNAIAVSTGRRLNVVRLFTQSKNLPDLTSLVINKGTEECGEGFTRTFDPEQARAEVFDFNWGAVSLEFDLFVQDARKRITKPRKVGETAAREAVYTYWKDHRDELPATIAQRREKIVALVMSGVVVEDAFEHVLKGD